LLQFLLGATAAAIQTDNALIDLLAGHGNARCAGQARAVDAQGSARTTVNKAANVASKSTKVASANKWRAGTSMS